MFLFKGKKTILNNFAFNSLMGSRSGLLGQCLINFVFCPMKYHVAIY